VVRLGLGVPLGRAVVDLADTPEEEELGWMAAAVAAHIRTGGDLGSRLSELASIARERRELQREVQSAATQGGFSGAIVAALVPVSAAMLVATNPEYMRILLDTLPGQALLVIAVLLQMGGWALIRRLTRLEFSR
jgi:Flp pilus assembly protein TadB